MSKNSGSKGGFGRLFSSGGGAGRAPGRGGERRVPPKLNFWGNPISLPKDDKSNPKNRRGRDNKANDPRGPRKGRGPRGDGGNKGFGGYTDPYL